MKQKLHLD
ncbi:UNVERIFIED_CONTAM: hypothetical protein GTU68_005218 [Idotea baltica]|nr:hypothetical protein [Idotea baltica]